MKSVSTKKNYDLIVIGSGMGGLATASILAQYKKQKVLLLESHWTAGGFLHSFKRKGHEWDPGFHYIGDMSEGTQTRGCMDLVTAGRVQWQQLHEDFEHFMFPDRTFVMPSTREAHIERLKEEFPLESDNIDAYFDDISRIHKWHYRWYYSKLWAGVVADVISGGKDRKLAETITADYLKERFTDPLLIAVLTAQWGDFGTPPERSAFGVHARVVSEFLDGGYYAIGGSQKIADTVSDIVKENGGDVLVSHPVKEILIRDNKAYGVRVETRKETKEFYAPKIVSAAGLDTTFNRLVPGQYAQVERDRLKSAVRGMSATILFMGIKDDPRKFGFKDTNYWMYDRLEHSYEDATVSFPPSIGNTTLSFASLRNPALKKHVAQLVTFSWYDDWKRFADKPWKKRGPEYEKLKEQYIENLLDFVEERIPGLRDIITYRELSTPVTVETMSGHVNGQVYGRECSPLRIKDKWSIQTSVKNLYLTGTDIVIPGVNSGLMSGVMTAAKLMPPLGVPRLLYMASKSKGQATVSEERPLDGALPHAPNEQLG
ncbi:MAG: phytoene desaturase family protein [Granulosicoccus sp.]